ncbi:MAG: hypothetical protein KF819_21340 [Labilithrix sp.]|nr:hypothetical protein [Labilithrix sp.]
MLASVPSGTPGLVATFVGALLVASCGGAPAKPPEPPAPAETAAPKPETPPPGAGSSATAADHHRDFMSGCAKKAINSPDYCECAWGEFRKVFTDEEMSSGDMPAAKLERVKSQVVGACASKIPEESIRDAFVTGCVGEGENAQPETKSFCECTWTEFRKKFSAAELGDEGTIKSERFTSARTPAIKVCAAKMPDGVAKAGFMKGCAKDPKAQPFCTCAWKELRKQVSAAELYTDTFDEKPAFAKVEKACGKLRKK